MSFWDDLVEFWGDNDDDIITGLGSLLGASGILNSEQDKVGYLGKIPEYDAYRTQLYNPHTNPYESEEVKSRRPGSGGLRYFTDTFYGTNADNVPTIADAAAQALEQKAYLEDVNKFSSEGYAAGGIAGIKEGRYLGGPTDGMGDQVNINAADGEFVVPADAVSHLGNGNSNAGAEQLYAMLDRIRKARTGSTEQGKRIDPAQFMPK
jgi:hypothetical protein